MKLEIQSIEINNLVAGSKTYANKKDLFIDLNDLENHLLEDPCIATIELEIIHKDNDSTRILKIIDAFQSKHHRIRRTDPSSTTTWDEEEYA